ncbi:MAG: prepilin-type N-terminal cleavage/methylation domain-containing protein [Phycisphaerales bacterium]|nr:prepilin-type N-terminal cleavage/methylation domain-containing protein [Phycisphaerales bacterium]
MFSSIRRNTRAFSLIELVIVVVIIGIIAAIAIPRMSRGATGANDNALLGNLSVLRKAVDLYQAEHSAFPTDETTITNQLTQYTDAAGAVSATRTGNYIYGPYLRAIPPLTVGAAKSQVAFVATQGGTTAGWVYDATAGTVKANCPDAEVDAAGKKYNTY